MLSDLALVAMQALFLTYLQKEGTVSERETAVHALSATDANIVIDNILKIGRLHLSAGKRIDGTKLVLSSFVSRERLRIKKSGAKIAIAAHHVIVKTFDSRHHFDALVCTDSAADTFFGIDLPNLRIADNFLFCNESTDRTEQSGGNAVSTARFQQ